MERVLITGGAGFIGSHLADALLASGYRVRVLDSLDPQVHGPRRLRPPWLDRRIDLRIGDVRDGRAVNAALDDVTAIFHLAAAVGVGQSMYRIADYTAANNMGTATLLQALMERPVRRLVVASSMSIYGEGRYESELGVPEDDVSRDAEALRAGRWEPAGPDGGALRPVPTPEDKRPSLSSIYALSKYDQERMCLLAGQAHRFEVTALRFFNVYGARQALGNPYTGVLAIFAARLLNRRPPIVFEDGQQRRDLVSVHDVARACLLALERREAAGEVLNVGSGRAITVLEIAERLAHVLGVDLAPEVTGRYRVGDVRHCFADIERARHVLGYAPEVELEDGMGALAEWLRDQQQVEDRTPAALSEVDSRGLTL